jgi:hypothetical protein
VLFAGIAAIAAMAVPASASGSSGESPSEGSGVPPVGSPALHAVIVNTLAARSLEIVETATVRPPSASGGGPCSSEGPHLIVYNAPNRLESESALEGCRALAARDWTADGPTITVGDTEYDPAGSPGHFHPTNSNFEVLGGAQGTITPFLGALGDVRQEAGGTFSFSSSSPPLPGLQVERDSGTIETAHGLLSKATWTSFNGSISVCGTIEQPATTYVDVLSYRLVDQAPQVLVPELSEIIRHLAPARASRQYVTVLEFGGEPQQCSGLQLRWSLGAKPAPCQQALVNPASGAAPNLSRFGGRLCYRLSPAVLVLHRAAIRIEAPESARSHSVLLSATLPSWAGSLLRQRARRMPRGKLAVVMFGHILAKVTSSQIVRSRGLLILPLVSPPGDLLVDAAASLGSRL